MHSILRSARPVTRSLFRPSAASSVPRAFSISVVRKSSGPSSPSLFGEGAKTGEVPTDANQSTGLERFQALGFEEGVDVFDLEPLDSSKIGTLQDPIMVFSLHTQRIIGCTGSPADSHDVHWYSLQKDKNIRCAECGSVYKMDFQGSEDQHGHGGHH